MIDELSIVEKQFADIKAAEYRAKGYQVLRDAPLDFLPGYRADMVVKNGYEIKVVEVKTRPSLLVNPALSEFERIINAPARLAFRVALGGRTGKGSGRGKKNARALDEGRYPENGCPKPKPPSTPVLPRLPCCWPGLLPRPRSG